MVITSLDQSQSNSYQAAGASKTNTKFDVVGGQFDTDVAGMN